MHTHAIPAMKFCIILRRHISAFQVDLQGNGNLITVLDTPGLFVFCFNKVQPCAAGFDNYLSLIPRFLTPF
jgi:hypothetical protein